MATKYYQASNANSAIRHGGSVFRFETTVLVSGSWWGVYASDTDEEQAVLDEMVSSNAVTSLTKDQYDSAKKKAADSRNSPSLGQESQLQKAEDVEPVAETKEESLDDILKVEKVTAPAKKKSFKKKK